MLSNKSSSTGKGFQYSLTVNETYLKERSRLNKRKQIKKIQKSRQRRNTTINNADNRNTVMQVIHLGSMSLSVPVIKSQNIHIRGTPNSTKAVTLYEVEKGRTRFRQTSCFVEERRAEARSTCQHGLETSLPSISR